MKKTWPLVFLLTPFQVLAQHPTPNNSIQGTVVDSASHLPIGFATIFLLDAKTAQQVKSMLAKSDGSFEISGIRGWDCGVPHVYNPFTKFNNYWSDTKTPDFAQSTFN